MSDQEDLKQIGVSIYGKQILKQIVKDYGWFEEEGIALKFAICIALKFDLKVDHTIKPETAQNVKSWDDDQVIQNLISDAFPDEHPYRHSQYLGDIGLRFIAEKVEKEEWSISNFLD